MGRTVLNVFMWHRVLPEGNDDAISVAMFRRQLRYLREHYSRLLSGAELTACLAGECPVSGCVAAVTFDDGWLDNLLYATPVLAETGTPATLALSTGFLHDETGPERLQRQACAGRSCAEAFRLARQTSDCRSFLSLQAVGELLGSGLWSIQAHGHTHIKGGDAAGSGSGYGSGTSALACTADDAGGRESRAAYMRRVKDDLIHCRKTIAEVSGSEPDLLFWPWGHYTKEGLGVAADAGFRFTLSTEKGHVIPPHPHAVPVPRIGVSPRWSKFVRNVRVHRRPLLSHLHRLVSPSPSGRRVLQKERQRSV